MGRSPSAARLFVDFALSLEGQAVFGEAALIGQDSPLDYGDRRRRGRFPDSWIRVVLKP